MPWNLKTTFLSLTPSFGTKHPPPQSANSSPALPYDIKLERLVTKIKSFPRAYFCVVSWTILLFKMDKWLHLKVDTKNYIGRKDCLRHWNAKCLTFYVQNDLHSWSGNCNSKERLTASCNKSVYQLHRPYKELKTIPYTLYSWLRPQISSAITEQL